MSNHSKIRCITCQYFKPKLDGSTGYCRRFPPFATRYGSTYWPKVLSQDLCGEYVAMRPTGRSDAADITALDTEPQTATEGLNTALLQSAKRTASHSLFGFIVFAAVLLLIGYLASN